MLKYEYKIMYKAAKVQNLILNKLAKDQQNEIIRLKAENARLTEGNKFFDMAPPIQSKTSKINLIA